jgi:hypothetical protein
VSSMLNFRDLSFTAEIVSFVGAKCFIHCELLVVGGGQALEKTCHVLLTQVGTFALDASPSDMTEQSVQDRAEDKSLE